MDSIADLHQSERLKYRSISESDQSFIHSMFNNDPQGQAQLWGGLAVPFSEKRAKAWMAQLQSFYLAVVICAPRKVAGPQLNPDNISSAEGHGREPVGVINLHQIDFGRSHHRCASIGIALHAKFRNNGYGSEAIRWILDWAFKQANLHRVAIQVDSFNTGACRLYQRLGFTLEGRERECVWHNGAYHDTLYLGMLDREWAQRQNLGISAVETHKTEDLDKTFEGT